MVRALSYVPGALTLSVVVLVSGCGSTKTVTVVRTTPPVTTARTTALTEATVPVPTTVATSTADDRGEINVNDGVILARAQLQIAHYCVDYLKGGFMKTSVIDHYIRGLQTLTRLYRKEPHVKYVTSLDGPRTLRQVLLDQASSLASEHCDPDGVRTLKQVVHDG